MTNQFKKTVRSLINSFGLEVIRYKPKQLPLSWMKDLGIATIIDGGANIGQFASEARAALPEAMIYSFEPIKACYESLNQTMVDDAHFKAFNVALGDKNETAQINVNQHAPSSSLLELSALHTNAYPRSLEERTETIQVKRLDDVANDLDLNPGLLIKLDVQGFEDRVIVGGLVTIGRAKALLVELCLQPLYEGQVLFDGIHKTLTDRGFVYRGSVNTKLDRNGLPLFEDGVFIRP